MKAIATPYRTQHAANLPPKDPCKSLSIVRSLSLCSRPMHLPVSCLCASVGGWVKDKCGSTSISLGEMIPRAILDATIFSQLRYPRIWFVGVKSISIPANVTFRQVSAPRIQADRQAPQASVKPTDIGETSVHLSARAPPGFDQSIGRMIGCRC